MSEDDVATKLAVHEAICAERSQAYHNGMV